MLASWFLKMKFKNFKGRSFDDSFYEEITDEEWRILRTHTAQTTRQVKKNSELSGFITEDMLFMQTNVLSPIPECFDLQAPRVPGRPLRDSFKDSRPPKTHVQVKKRPPNEPLVRTKSDEQSIRKSRERAKKFKSEEATSIDKENDTSKPSKSQKSSRIHVTEDAQQDAQSENQSYTYKKTKSKIRWKTKTKIRRNMWRTKSAPALNRMNNVEDEMTSCTEYSQETNISFASYMKKRAPNFGRTKTTTKSKSKKLKRFEATQNLEVCGFTGRNEKLHSASQKNVTFNPIFEEDENEKKEEHMYYNTPAREYHVNVSPKQTPYTSTIDQTNHVQSSCSPETCYQNDEDHVPVTRIDQNFEESEYENNVPVTDIHQYNDDIHDDHVQNPSDHVRPSLVRSRHIEDLDMCNWYSGEDDDFDNHYNDDDDDDDDDFTNRMLQRTSIITFDMTYRRRELYTIEEEPEEQ